MCDRPHGQRVAMPGLVGMCLLLVMQHLAGCSELDRSLSSLGLPTITRTPGLTEEKITAGLKEALEIGTGNAVNFTGRLDGYFRNQAIKIPMPSQLESFEKGLRLIGFGVQVDEFVESMNRAAEHAAPQAEGIFLGAIRDITFADARHILSGTETAATDYFRRRTTEQLTTAFRPIVSKSMDQVGVTRQYKDLTQRLKSLPFARSEKIDLDQYVTSRALDGLFIVLGDEERRIRQNPAARVTDLLRDVFTS